MSNKTEFIEAAKMGDTAAVISLLEREPELVNCAGEHDKTALHWAAEKGDSVTAAVLIEAGADIEAKTDWGTTPLEWAGVMGSIAVADLLREKGASGFDLKTAAALGKLDEVKNFTPDAPKEDLDAAVYGAARNGHIETVRYLLERGGDINAKGFFGATGLHWAAINGHMEMARFLVERGADLTLKDDEFNATPEDWAIEGGFQSIAEVLKKAGEEKA
jgi:ankyrin repeat protein